MSVFHQSMMTTQKNKVKTLEESKGKKSHLIWDERIDQDDVHYINRQSNHSKASKDELSLKKYVL
jgi:hypothetical protein